MKLCSFPYFCQSFLENIPSWCSQVAESWNESQYICLSIFVCNSEWRKIYSRILSTIHRANMCKLTHVFANNYHVLWSDPIFQMISSILRILRNLAGLTKFITIVKIRKQSKCSMLGNTQIMISPYHWIIPIW